MSNRMHKAIKDFYREELKQIKTPAIPGDIAEKRLLVPRRRIPLMEFGVAACLLVAGFVALSPSGSVQGELAKLITEKSRTYEWDKRLEAEFQKIPQAFFNAFTKRF